MANRLSDALGSVTNRLIAVIGALSAIVGIAVPAVKDFAVAHPLWGWSLFLATVILLPAVTGSPTLDKKAVARTKDTALLRDRLTGWELDSDFFRYLTQRVTHEHLSLNFVSDLEQHLERWEFDAREMTTREVRNKWLTCKKAALRYAHLLDQNTFLKNSGKAYEVPREWEREDPERWRSAFEQLPAARQDLAEAIQASHRILHED